MTSVHYIVRRKPDGDWLSASMNVDFTTDRNDAFSYPTKEFLRIYMLDEFPDTPYDLIRVTVETTEEVVEHITPP